MESVFSPRTVLIIWLQEAGAKQFTINAYFTLFVAIAMLLANTVF